MQACSALPAGGGCNPVGPPPTSPSSALQPGRPGSNRMHPPQEPPPLYKRDAPARIPPSFQNPQPNTSAIELGASIAMELTNQGVPADPSSSIQQPQPYLPPSPLWPHQRAVQRPQPQLALPPPPPQPQYPPPMELPPQLPSFPQPPPPLRPQQLYEVPPYLPMLQPQGLGYIPSAAAAIPGSINASRFFGHASMAPRQGTWGDSFRMFETSAEQSSSTPSFSAGRGQTSAGGPRSGATVPFSARGDNAILDPYASALLNAGQVDPRSWSWAPAIPHELTLEDVRGHLLVNQLVPEDVGLAGSSALVIQLLKEGNEVVRRNVFCGVLGALRFVMGNNEWHGVFIELLCERRLPELRNIVRVACTGGVPLLNVANAQCGVTSLGILIVAVKWHPQLRRQLINRLLKEDLFLHSRGTELLHVIFSTFPDEDSSIIIRCAIGTFSGVLATKFGSMSMVECFVFAKNAELQQLEETILWHTVEIAKGQFSNYYLQRVLERGGGPLKVNITHRVLHNLVSLSMDRHGAFVVQACFVVTGSARVRLLQRVLTEFQRLPDQQLALMVEDPYANYVVSRVLKEGKGISRGPRSLPIRDATTALARRIEMLQATGLHSGWTVMKAVRKVLS